MASSRSHSFTLTFRVVLALPDVSETLGPVLTEQNLAGPDESFDAVMDYPVPRDGNAEICAKRNDVWRISVGLWTTLRIPTKPATN